MFHHSLVQWVLNRLFIGEPSHIEGVLSPGEGLSGIFCDGSTLWNDPTVFLSGDRKGKDCISVCNFDWDGSADADRTGPF